MRILFIGASGLIGSHLLQEAIMRGHIAIGTFRRHRIPGLVYLDLTDHTSLERLLDDCRPDWVVHAAGWTWVDGCEKDPVRAMVENCHQPAALARACRARNIRFAYFSTTYVFDGKAGPYGESDCPRPINVYGQSKLAGENAVKEILGNVALLPRIICPWGKESQRKNFVYQVMRAVATGNTLRIPSDQIGNPTYAGDIAAWCLSLLELNQGGIWHLCSPWKNLTRVAWVESILLGLRRDLRWAKASTAWKYETLPTSQLGKDAPRPLHAGAHSEQPAVLSTLVPRNPAAIDALLTGFDGDPNASIFQSP
jgi:dTDP-4-dehydrorhamnose reductase